MKTKRIIFWIGEHAYSTYKMTPKNTLDEFDNYILLYSRKYSPDISKNDTVTFLDEYYPLPNDNYDSKSMHTPIGYFLRNKIKNNTEVMLIGDHGELLFQTALQGLEITANRNNGVDEELFQMAAFRSVDQNVLFPDTTGMDVLFLKSMMPFVDNREEDEQQRLIAKKWFGNVMECQKVSTSLDGFLSLYSHDLNEALKRNENIKRI